MIIKSLKNNSLLINCAEIMNYCMKHESIYFKRADLHSIKSLHLPSLISSSRSTKSPCHFRKRFESILDHFEKNSININIKKRSTICFSSTSLTSQLSVPLSIERFFMNPKKSKINHTLTWASLIFEL